MNKTWDLTDPKQGEAALEYYFSLPDNEENSEEEGDEGATDEYEELDKIESNLSASSTPKSSPQHSPYSSLASSSCQNSTPSTSKIARYLDEQPSTSTGVQHFVQQPLQLTDSQHGVEDFSQTDAHISSEDDDYLDGEEEWGKNTDYFDNFNVKFDEKKPSPFYNFDKKSKEIDYFLKIFTEEMFTSIVEQTNLFASQPRCRKSKNIGEPCTSKNWTDTTIVEIKALFGMMILMGIHNMPRVANYWSSEPYLSVKCVAEIMSSKRYKKLIENLHINDNTKAVEKNNEGYDKLHKVRPLVDSLRTTISASYNHSSLLAVDESMIPFKGRSFIKQYMPNKPIKWGYKVWCLADSMTGYIYSFDIYVGKSEGNKGPNLLGERVVLQLTREVQHKNCFVVFDNFFTTYSLVKKLKSKGIYSAGTVRSNRKGLPSMMKTKSKLSRGEFMFETKGCVAAVKWMDNNPVNFISSCFSPTDTTFVLRKNKKGQKINVSCPQVVAQYNNVMGGVDRFDQLRERYEIGRRSIKWWFRIFYYLLDLAIINSYILMKSNGSACDQLQFRVNLARQLIAGFSSRKMRNKTVHFLANKRSVPEEVRLSNVGKHLPNKEKTYRRCRLCSTTLGEKRTKITCLGCRVPLCLHPCFNKFHGK